MQDILIVVDMQNDFVDGSLGTPEAQRIVDHVVEKIMHFEGRVLFTQDTHESDYLETQEGVRLPVEHCIRGTKGWELVPAIEALLMPESQVIEKPTFGSSELVGLLERLNEEEPIRSFKPLFSHLKYPPAGRSLLRSIYFSFAIPTYNLIKLRYTQ
jgi:hypothetical protein